MREVCLVILRERTESAHSHFSALRGLLRFAARRRARRALRCREPRAGRRDLMQAREVLKQQRTERDQAGREVYVHVLERGG